MTLQPDSSVGGKSVKSSIYAPFEVDICYFWYHICCRYASQSRRYMSKIEHICSKNMNIYALKPTYIDNIYRQKPTYMDNIYGLKVTYVVRGGVQHIWSKNNVYVQHISTYMVEKQHIRVTYINIYDVHEIDTVQNSRICWIFWHVYVLLDTYMGSKIHVYVRFNTYMP